jgi:hypothetical protein
METETQGECYMITEAERDWSDAAPSQGIPRSENHH